MTEEPDERTVNILDGVVVIRFTCAGFIDEFVQTLERAGYRVFVPEEVVAEAAHRTAVEGWNLSGLYRHLGTTIVQIPTITAASGQAMADLARLRARHPSGKFSAADGGDPTKGRDLGECVVIARAMGARRQGNAVVVGIDDGDGQRLAAAMGFDCFTIERVLEAAVIHGVFTFAEAKDAYMKMTRFGGLPGFDANPGLRPALRAAASTRKSMLAVAEAQAAEVAKSAED